MAEKVLNTRIITKHAELAALESSNLVLKEGEIVLAKVSTILPDGGTQENFIAKVGNNATFANSPWLYAKASDVYAWAKKSELEVADVPALPIDKITGLQDALNAKVDQTAYNTKMAELATAISNANSDALADAQEYADGLNTAMDTRVKAIENDHLVAADKTELQNSINGVNGKVTNLEASVGGILNADTGIEAKAKKYTDQEVSSAKTALQTNIDAKVDKSTYDGKITSLEAADSALGDRIGDVENKLADVTNVMDFRGAVAAKPAVEGYQNGDVIVVTEGDDAGKEFVLSNGEWVEFGSTSATDAAVAALQTRVSNVETNKADKTALTTETTERKAADKTLTDNLAALDTRVGANETAISGHTTSINDLSTNKADKTTVTGIDTRLQAVEGNYVKINSSNELVDQADNVIIFDCGGAE